jgi:tetratricopeptide (TPR) repeat protein
MNQRSAALLLLACCLGIACPSTKPLAATGEQSPPKVDRARLAALVDQLGDPEYAQRHAAMQELEQLGGLAIDQLLQAAEQSDDLEVALQARWLVHSIPLSRPQDPPAVVELLDSYKSASLSRRVTLMHRLLRLEDAAGIEPLARLLRLEQSPAAARAAAALLVREWSPDDPFFRGVIPAIRNGLGSSHRPTAELVAALVDVEEGRPQAIDELLATMDRLQGVSLESGETPVPALDPADDTSDLAAGLSESTTRIFQRCRLQALLAAGRQSQALDEAEVLLVASDDAEEQAGFLIWCVEHGLAAVVSSLDFDATGSVDESVELTFAAAVALAAVGEPARAEEVAAAASRLASGESMDRLQAAMLLAKWGADEWALREYRRILEDPQPQAVEYVLGAIMYSEFLHDRGQEAEAAAALAAIFQPPAKGFRPPLAGNVDPESILRQLDRDPRATRSRMLYFEACAAALRGDTAVQRQKLEESVRTLPKDVDALIALHGLEDATPLQLQAVRRQIDAALELIETEIRANPEEANGYNEFAWLVANTIDASTPPELVTRATRYSQRSLEIAETASYLDTLAHCHAAEGRFDRAVRTQSLAARYEPHNQTIHRNLERFRREAAGSAGGDEDAS